MDSDCGPTRKNCDRHEQRGQQYQPQTNAVNPKVITRTDSSNPVDVLLEPELGRFIGHWGGADPVAKLVFDGYRFRPNVIS